MSAAATHGPWTCFDCGKVFASKRAAAAHQQPGYKHTSWGYFRAPNGRERVAWVRPLSPAERQAIGLDRRRRRGPCPC